MVTVLIDPSLLTRPQDLPFVAQYYIFKNTKHNYGVLKSTSLSISNPPGTWKSAAKLPSYRYESGIAVLKGEIYIIGGLTLPSVYNVSKKVEVYNPKTDSWRKVHDIPKITHHISAAASEDKIYIAGGNGLRVSKYKSLYEYDPKKDTWTQLEDMSIKRAAMGLVYFRGMLYAIGGITDQGPTNLVEAYDIKTGKWSKRKPMPTAREHINAVVINNQIYIMGGFNKPHPTVPLTANEAYDPQTDTWSKKAPLPIPLSTFIVAVPGSQSIFVIGGQQNLSTSNLLFEYKINEDKWYRKKDLPVARYGHTATLVKHRIHVFGGSHKIYGYRLLQNHDIFIPQ